MIGGTSALEITSPTTRPQITPIPMAITNARGAASMTSFFSSIPMDIPDNARVDIIEISIPPISITHSIPRAITIVTALFFSISIRDFGVRKDGLMAVMTIKRTIRTTASRASRDPVSFFTNDFFSIILKPPFPWQARGSSPESLPLFQARRSFFRCTLQ